MKIDHREFFVKLKHLFDEYQVRSIRMIERDSDFYVRIIFNDTDDDEFSVDYQSGKESGLRVWGETFEYIKE